MSLFKIKLLPKNIFNLQIDLDKKEIKTKRRVNDAIERRREYSKTDEIFRKR